MQPVVNRLIYTVPDGTSYIDLWKDVSAINRRLYPQGRVAVISKIQHAVFLGGSAVQQGVLAILALPNSWPVHNAWKKANAAWTKQQNSVRGSMAPGKWHDFKVYFDATHNGGGTVVSATDVDQGEWEYSKFVYDDNGTVRTPAVHMLGATSATEVGLVEEYGLSRALTSGTGGMPHSLATAADSIYSELISHDDIIEDLVDDVRDDNDLPPYDHDEYPGGAGNNNLGINVSYSAAGGPGSSGVRTFPGFLAPCGLLKLANVGIATADGSATTAPTTYLIVELAYGKYKGLTAPEMGQ